MSISEKMTGLMNAVRAMSGTVGKLSVDDATSVASSAGQWGVRTPNLISDSSDQYQVIPSVNSFKLYQGPVKAGTKYTFQTTVKGSSVDVHLNVGIYDSNWEWVTQANGSTLVAGDERMLQISFTPEQNGYAMYSIQTLGAKESLSGKYKCAMLNEGDYAPYTAATKPYTVDELASRLARLENKVGGGN